jgi:ribosomal protein S12 methylthiotransferase
VDSSSNKKVYFVSLGCPKNRVDSEVMLGSMGTAGHQLVDDPGEAEVIVVNTCGFIDAAKEESIDTILEMAQYKQSGCEKLVVTGCLTQRYPEEVAKEIPEIDHILGSADYREIAGIVGGSAAAAAEPEPSGKRRIQLPVIQVSETPEYLYDHSDQRVITGHRHSVYVKIAEGCDRPCSFCIIPKLRGPQRSRSIESVVKEVEDLVASGTVEVNLVAQDLTRYGADLDDKPTLAALLREVCKVEGLRWVRLHYTFPTAFSDELIDVIASEPKIVKYVDVPLQHIAFDMLKRMRRGHSPKVTHELVRKLRERVPNLILRTTFIVGHPGETDEEFEELCQFVEEVEFDHVGVFTYSAEPGTHSATLGDEIPQDVMEARQERLMAIQQRISRAKKEALVGQEIEVLVDGISDESDLLLQGRWYGQAPDIDGVVYLTDGTAQPGDVVRAKVTDFAEYDLAASILEG